MLNISRLYCTNQADNFCISENKKKQKSNENVFIILLFVSLRIALRDNC